MVVAGAATNTQPRQAGGSARAYFGSRLYSTAIAALRAAG
jgi:hypothetical protein